VTSEPLLRAAKPTNGVAELTGDEYRAVTFRDAETIKAMLFEIVRKAGDLLSTEQATLDLQNVLYKFRERCHTTLPGVGTKALIRTWHGRRLPVRSRREYSRTR
jgi:hypothetical protein